MIKYLYLFVLLLLISCQTNPPTEPADSIKVYGKVEIKSNVAGALIFIDGLNTQRVTPDTITILIGSHKIELRKQGFDKAEENIIVKKDNPSVFTVNMFASDKLVLLEDFANVSCNPCVISNKIIEQFTSRTFGKTKLAAIKYPTNFPSPVDLFYLANSSDCNSRMSYYNILFAPTTIINGTLKPIPSDSNDVKEKIFAEFSEVPKFSLIVNDDITSGNYTITISLSVLDETDVDFSNLVLHTVVTETNIEFANPPGSNGETKFFDVMRKMLPNKDGESLASINKTGTNLFQRQLNLNTGWVQNKINTVVFIQDKKTKKIYQASSTF